MPDLDNVTPAGGNAAPGAQQLSAEGAEPDPAPAPDPEPNQPPLSNAARKAEKERAEAEAEGDGEGEGETPDPEADPKAALEEANKDEAELDTEVWGDMGDDVANSVLQTLQNSGVTTEDAKALLWDAVEAGDPAKVDRDALVEKVGKAKATLIMAGVENVTTRNNAKLEEVTKIAHESAGGKDNWTKATKWAHDNMPKEEVSELRDMLDKGGRQAKFAAKEIVERFNADPKNTSLTAGKNQVTPDSKAGKAVEPISRRQYGVELEKLHRKGGSEAEFNALRARRAEGQKQGI